MNTKLLPLLLVCIVSFVGSYIFSFGFVLPSFQIIQQSALFFSFAIAACLYFFSGEHQNNKDKRDAQDSNVIENDSVGIVQVDLTSCTVSLNSFAQSLLNVKHATISLENFSKDFGHHQPIDISESFASENDTVISLYCSNIENSSGSISMVPIVNHQTQKVFVLESKVPDSDFEFLFYNEKKRFEQLANALPIFLTTFNAKGKIDFISDNHVDMFGMTPEELHNNWLKFIYPDDIQRTEERWVAALKSQRATTLKYRVIDKNGCIGHFVSHCKPVTVSISGDNENNMTEVKWFVASFDNSSTEQLSLENDKMAAKLQGILQGMEDGFVSLNQDLEIEYFNFKAEILISILPHAEGLHASNASTFFDTPSLLEVINQVNSDQITRNLTITYNQSELLTRVHASPNGVRLYIQDITAEKASLDELSLLRQAIDKANDVVLITKALPLSDPGPEVVYVNDAFERVTGFQKSEILGRSPRILQGPDTQTETLAEIKSALIESKPVRVLVTNYTKEGHPYDNEIDISPIINSQGITTHFIAIERDISKQKAQEDLSFRAHKMDSIGLVTGGVAHDFNNLLTIILGNADILADDTNALTESSKHEKLLSITEAANQGVSLTRSLLAFSKRQPFSEKKVNLASIITSMTPIITTALGAQIHFEVSNETDVTFVQGDQSQLESLFLNMAINARDAINSQSDNTGHGHFQVLTRKEQIDPSDILATTLEPGVYSKLIFRDDGPGIKKEHIDNIFDPFFSTKPLTKGTGLGLSMIYSFISQSGGHIEVKSKLGKGTDFIVYLKSLDNDNVQQMEVSNSQSTDQNEISYSGKTVLIVEDTEMVAKVAQFIFGSVGFKVLMAEDANIALQHLENNEVDLLFTDIILPNGMDGKALSHEVRKQQPNVPIIYTSGFTDGKLQHEDYQSQNIEFLQKPYTKKDLLNTLIKITF